MKLSVIIPTFNGENKILNLLYSLEKQTYKDFEVIIIIDGSTDNTKQILEKYLNNHKSIRIIEQNNQGRAVVRNNGVKYANGDLLLFIDDDMVLVENCIYIHVEHHKNFPNSILTGVQCENKIKCKTDFQSYKAYLSEKWNNVLKTLMGKPLPKENIFITAANFSISKETFIKLDGFDERLKDIEDYDLAIRAFEKDIPLYFDFNAFAWHNEEITCLSYINRQREYSKMYNKLLIMKPLLYSKHKIRNLSKLNGFKEVIIIIFTFKFWIWSVDKFNWLIILPKRLRYKIYDIIILANGVYYKNNKKD